MAPSEVDFYKTLAVHRHATDDDIKKAFRKAARDTHPDKNPDDPLAKEKFQELQSAYDTLKDQLERSKYDEDNPYHGLPEGSRPKPKSTTAKRYTGGSSTGSTAPTGATPGWTTGSASFPRGFAHQAHQTHSTPNSRHTGGYKTTYEDFTGSTYGGARRQRSGGFDYSSTYRAQPPKPTTTEFDGSYYYEQSQSYNRPGSPRAHETSYTRTSSQRQPNATPTGTPKPSGSTRRAHSTVGGQRDPGAQPPDFNIGAYIKERRAREEEQARRDEEAKEREKLKREEAQRAAREEAQRTAREEAQRAAREAQRAREAEIEKRLRHERKKEELRRAEEHRKAEEEARRAEEEEERKRNHWAQSGSSQFSKNDFVNLDLPQFHGGHRDEDLLRTVDERLAEGQRKSKTASNPASRSNSRRSPTKPRVRRDNEWGTNGHSDGWGTKSGNVSDHSGSFRNFTPAGDEELSYHENAPQRDEESQAAERRAEQQQQRREQQRKWEEMPKNSDNIYQGHGRTKSETQPRERPSTPDRPRTSGHETPLGSVSGGSKRESPSFDSSNNKRRQSSTDFRFKVPPGVNRVDSYRSESRDSPPPPQDSPFQKKPDFRFHGEVPSPFTYTTPEELSQQNQNNLYATPTFTRPQSQPVYPTQPQHIPISRPTPQPQQQQQRQQERQQNDIAKGLLDVLNQTAFEFGYRLPQPSPKKKKSATSVKSFNKFRAKSKESVGAEGVNANIKVGSGNDGEEGSGSAEPKQAGVRAAGTPHTPVAGDEGFEPMDTGPDTGIPDPINIQATMLNGHMGPKSPRGNPSPRIPTPLSPRSTKEDGLETMHKLGSVHPLKTNGLDSMSNLAAVPPFSRSPAEVGLDGLNELKDNLPLPSRSSGTPKPGFSGPLPKYKPGLRDIYAPATPMEEPFVNPVAPKVPKTPKDIDLTSYNQFFMRVETYVESWNTYEDTVRRLQVDLCNKNLKHGTLDTNAIMEYIRRVKEKDFVLEKSYYQAREKHMAALEEWVSYRTDVVANRNNS